MKKLVLSISIMVLCLQNSKACSWYDPDYEYFNLFTQDIIKDKSLTPFLLTYSNKFYSVDNLLIKDQNIIDWQKYFDNQLNYQDTYNLVYKLSLEDLNSLKKGNPYNPFLKKLGFSFYQKYKDGFDYLIEAKYLEPYMRIKFEVSPDSFYYGQITDEQNATQLDYNKTISALKSLYQSVQNPTIKLRYAYQMVRFNHYNRKYQDAVDAFTQFVAPLNIKPDVYYLALNQLAGAQKGLGDLKAANWNFFQVFLHTKDQKKSAFTSMKLTDENSFKDLLSQTKSDEEKSMAYFLLGYQDFNNPTAMMDKIFEINPKSELLQVLAARAINELERSYLPVYYNATAINNNSKTIDVASEKPAEPEKEMGFFARIWNFIKSLFSSSSTTSKNSSVDNPYRIPFFDSSNEYQGETATSKNYLSTLLSFIEKVKEKDNSEFWNITEAYLKFLNKDYKGSSSILKTIKTDNSEYLSQIKRMKMLNDIVSQPTIDADFENYLFKNYKDFFADKKAKDNPTEEFDEQDYLPTTSEFLKDVLANRYFLQGDLAKSFLMNNKLEDFRYNPDLNLAEKLDDFAKKENKNDFEKEFIFKNMNGVGDLNAYFNVIYGDYAMKSADFDKAKSFYNKAVNFKGYSLSDEVYDYETGQQKKIDISKIYDGFRNISSLVFGYNHFVSYGSPADETMRAESFVNEFPIIKTSMNKLELAETLIQLNKIGSKNDESAAKANQLIGNLLYNTSSLGYFRDLFVMDINNVDGGKYDFSESLFQYKVYYKNYANNVFFQSDNYDLSISYYQKALSIASNKDQKARLLFQMASAEQGKFYQYQAKNTPSIPYDDPLYDEKTKTLDEKIELMRKQKFQNYFTQLKENYSDTETSKLLMGSCSYYNDFIRK